MDLFADSEKRQLTAAAPLAVRMRPRSIEQFVGQADFVAPGKLLWRMLRADRLSSLIFYGPPGTGKTTLASVISHETSAHFHAANAASIGVAEIRQVIAAARDRLITHQKKTVLFLDEIHRFSKSQQDVLLEDVENGIVILIGATTENPFFSVNNALISRSTVFQFQHLSPDDLRIVMNQALADVERGLGKYNVTVTDDAAELLIVNAVGDARRLLTALEVGVLSQVYQKNADAPIVFDAALAAESIQRRAIASDAKGDNHFDLASALQKSMRGSDPDATVYWLARLIAGGEDPRFIARRIAVCAAEDVGNADPVATMLAAAAVQIAEFVGLPEAQLPLAQAAIYIACSPKSNRSAQAIWSAVSDVERGKMAHVPDHLKDSHYAAAKTLGHGTDYQYPHSHPGAYVQQDYLPADMDAHYYDPSTRGRERYLRDYLKHIGKLTTDGEQDQPPDAK